MPFFICALYFLFALKPQSHAEETTAHISTERRIEENNRTNLQPTEIQSDESRLQTVKSPQESINRKFYNRLFTQPIARKVDGIYVTMLLLGKQSDFQSFPEELDYLKQNRYIFKKSADWQLNDPLKKGELAFMLFKALKISGGLHIKIFGITPRYALLELSYLRLMSPGGENEQVSGKELASAFIRSANYLTNTNDTK